MQVVQYYNYYDMPFQAAQILEREMNAGRVSRETTTMLRLSDLYRQAREYKRAVPILEQAAYNGSSATLYGPLSKVYYETEQCEKVEEALKKGMVLGYDKGKAWMLIGTCYYEESTRLERIDCGMTDLQKSTVPRNVMRDRAMAAFSKVPVGAPEASDAGKWRYFIKAEIQAAQWRCAFERPRMHTPLCVDDWVNAYYNRRNTSEKLNLINPDCREYKAAYDKIYIVKKGGG